MQLIPSRTGWVASLTLSGTVLKLNDLAKRIQGVKVSKIMGGDRRNLITESTGISKRIAWYTNE